MDGSTRSRVAASHPVVGHRPLAAYSPAALAGPLVAHAAAVGPDVN